MGALIIRVGFWGLLHYNDNKDPPAKKKIALAPIVYRNSVMSTLSLVVHLAGGPP